MARFVVGVDVGIRTLSWCRVEIGGPRGAIPVVKEWVICDLLQGTPFPNTQRLPTSALHDLVLLDPPRLFQRSFLRGVTHLCIEQQPMGKLGSQKPLVLCHLLFQRARECLFSPDRGALRTVAFTPAGRKYRKTWMEAAGAASHPRGHAARKKLSVRLARHLLASGAVTNETKQNLAGPGKLDDLADAFLLALDACSGEHVHDVLGRVGGHDSLTGGRDGDGGGRGADRRVPGGVHGLNGSDGGGPLDECRG